MVWSLDQAGLATLQPWAPILVFLNLYREFYRRRWSVIPSKVGNFEAGNCCCRAVNGLFTTVTSCFLRTPVTPLFQGGEAKDLRDSVGSTILKTFQQVLLGIHLLLRIGFF